MHKPVYDIVVRNLTKIYNPSGISKIALNSVNLSVIKGSCLGIIGTNGSGKSTLLKILASIIKPSSGEIIINSKEVFSIIEIGSNFISDISGHENIKMSFDLFNVPKETREEKFKWIIEFADIGDYVNELVKHYSSGMYLRLAFAFALSIDAEILLIDEVLQVGDEAFKKKCFEQIKLRIKKKKTTVVCTHDLLAIKDLCDSCILLDKGVIKENNTTKIVVNKYLDSIAKKISESNYFKKEKQEIDPRYKLSFLINPEDTSILPVQLEVHNQQGSYKLLQQEAICIVFTFKFKKETPFLPLFTIFNNENEKVMLCFPKECKNLFSKQNFQSNKTQKFTCIIPAYTLKSGRYSLSVHSGTIPQKNSLYTPELFKSTNKLAFEVIADDKYFDFVGNTIPTSIRPKLDWSLE